MVPAKCPICRGFLLREFLPQLEYAYIKWKAQSNESLVLRLLQSSLIWFFFSVCFNQDCQDSLRNSEPEIKFALECGERLIDDDVADPEDKEKIQQDIEELARALKDLKEEAAKERIR